MVPQQKKLYLFLKKNFNDRSRFKRSVKFIPQNIFAQKGW